jgi:glycosyltransferase involved in cell wall biosynthesis
MSRDLITVVIPAYNAQLTIGSTLESVLRQTHRAMEVIVVDDGSTDRTREIVASYCRSDSRLRVLEQANAGVAAARNTGIAAAASDLIAPIDADDLWLPTKLEAQFARLQASDARCGLVYAWHMAIDDLGQILSFDVAPRYEGDVTRFLCRGNFIGNGSSPLMRRAAIESAGGYECALHLAHAQGCEDILMYYRVSRRWTFAVVPHTLVGYRHTPTNMSSDAFRMLRSWNIVADEMRRTTPEYSREIRQAGNDLRLWLLRRANQSGRRDVAASLATELMSRSPLYLPRFAVKSLLQRMRTQPGIEASDRYDPELSAAVRCA